MTTLAGTTPDATESALIAALKKLATKNTKLIGKGKALFPSKDGDHGRVIDRLTRGDEPLAAIAPAKGGEQATITAAGFVRVAEHLDPTTVGAAAVKLAKGMPDADLLAFAQRVIAKAAVAAVELEPLARKVVEKREKAHAEEARTSAALRKLQDETAAALKRLTDELERAKQARIRALQAELKELGASADIPPRIGDGKQPESPKLSPETDEDRTFLRQEVRRLVSAWSEAIRLGKKEGRHLMEVVLGNLSGVDAVGEADEVIPYDPAYHRCDAPPLLGEPVKVQQIGWMLTEAGGAEFVAAKARVVAEGT